MVVDRQYLYTTCEEPDAAGGGGDGLGTGSSSSMFDPVKPCALNFGLVNSNWRAIGIDNYKIGIHHGI